MRLGCENSLSMRIGVLAANWRLGCTRSELAFGLQIGAQMCSRTGHSYFPAPHIVCFPEHRPCGVCWATPRLRPYEQDIRTFRGLTSYASLLTGPAVLAGPQLDSVPANWLFGLFGAAHRMLPLQQALWFLQGRNSITSLPTGPSDFSGPHIVGFPDSKPCGVCGAAPLRCMRLGS